MFKACIENPTPPNFKELEEEESHRPLRSHGRGLLVGSHCCHHCLCGLQQHHACHVWSEVKFDDGEGLEDEACCKVQQLQRREGMSRKRTVEEAEKGHCKATAKVRLPNPVHK